jgi:uncharacterized protein (TIGR02145 family)
MGGALKYSNGFWNSPNTGATNNSGFSALPGGYRNSNGNFITLGNFTNIWSSSESNSNVAFYFNLFYNGSNLGRDTCIKNTGGFSIRCLKD